MRSLITPNQVWIIYASGNEAIAGNVGGGLTRIIIEPRNVYVWQNAFMSKPFIVIYSWRVLVNLL